MPYKGFPFYIVSNYILNLVLKATIIYHNMAVPIKNTSEYIRGMNKTQLENFLQLVGHSSFSSKTPISEIRKLASAKENDPRYAARIQAIREDTAVIDESKRTRTKSLKTTTMLKKSVEEKESKSEKSEIEGDVEEMYLRQNQTTTIQPRHLIEPPEKFWPLNGVKLCE